MPRRAQSIRSSQPQNGPALKEEEAESRRNSMPNLQSMGNEALNGMLAGGGPLVIPLAGGNESMSLVIDPGKDVDHESDSSENLDDSNMSIIDTSAKAKQRMLNPKIELVDEHGHEEDVKSEADAQEAVKKAEEKAPGIAEKAEGGENANDLQQAEGQMKPVEDWGFIPVEMQPNKEKGSSPFLHKFSQFLGATVGRVLGAVFNLGLLPFTGSILGFSKWWNKGFPDLMMEKRYHGHIPGWWGYQFEPEKPAENKKQTNEVDVDFRKIPAVWSYPIAAKAADPNPNPEHPDDPRDREIPVAPTVSVLVDQPEEGSSASILSTANMGHTMLGIEYSRFSQTTNRYERYSIQYGFYPAGGISSTISSTFEMFNNDAIVPGMLYDDMGHDYSISRKFKANPDQVKEIMKASESYADQGYGYYTRNCTTFVKDMIQHVGEVTGSAGDIFKQDQVQFGAFHDLAAFGSYALSANTKVGMESAFTDFAQRQDFSYNNFDHMRVTKQDYQNYKNSLSRGSAKKATDIPAMVGENLRRIGFGQDKGEMSSMKYERNLNEVGESVPNIVNACENESEAIKDIIRDILSEENPEQLPQELLAIIRDLPFAGRTK